jgi:hypothetical protein
VPRRTDFFCPFKRDLKEFFNSWKIDGKSLYLPLNMRKAFCFFLILCLLTTAAFSQTKVYLLPVLHSMHKSNFFYPYDSVKAVVARTAADVVAVEIRPEDISKDSNYLKANYPFEMWMMAHWFPQKTIVGFDWLGADLEGKPIPEKYWQQGSEIKKLQTALNKDSVYTARLRSCTLYSDERLKLLSSQSLKAILTSNDAILTKEYYNCLEQHLRGSEYEALTQFYTLRNQKMMAHLDALLHAHEGKTIVVVTGADHYPYLLDHLKKARVQVGKFY